MSYIDSVARLLAIENLIVERVPADTASFNLKDRVLRIPSWKGLTESTEQLMIVHETGHAKYTPLEGWEKTTDKKDDNFVYYVNVCEDARIEKLMKREYPGVRKEMLAGYADLQDRNFFGVKKKSIDEINKMSLINKINLYTKLGVQFGIRFDAAEQVFVDRVERIETFEEASQLAKDIYAFSKEKAEKMFKISIETSTANGKKQACKPGIGDADAEEAHESGLLGGQGGMSYGEDSLEKYEDMMQRYLAVTTEEMFKENLKAQVDNKATFLYKNLNIAYTRDPVIPYKTVLTETTSMDRNISSVEDKIRDFRRDCDQIVAYLVKEFEMKKSADLNKRAVVSKTGQLDMRKVFAYQLKDDLFRRVTTIPQGKNHGMVFMVDWSGSMSYTIHKTMLQVLNLTSFCKRMQIPFRVFAFSDHYRNQYGVASRKAVANPNPKPGVLKPDANTLDTNDGGFALLELLSSEMTNKEYTTMFNRLYCTDAFTRIPAYQLGGTPLNHSMLYMLDYLPRFRTKYNIQKLSFVVLTDGEGNPCSWSYPYDDRYTNNQIKKQRTIVRDLETRKEYEMGNGSRAQTKTLIQIIKDKCNVNVIGFHLTTRSAVRTGIETHTCTSPDVNEIAKAEADFNATGAHAVQGAAHDLMCLIDTGKLTISESEATDGIDEEDSASQAARRLVKNFSGALKTRIILDKFIQTMA